MGRKTSRREKAADDGEWSENASVATTSTTYGDFQDEDEEPQGTQEFRAACDDLYEKRGGTRESALQRLSRLLRADVREEDCARTATTLTERCLNSVRKGGAAEGALAATVLGKFRSAPA